MMSQLLTATVASNLYWLGRYLERTETTLLEVLTAYDKIIDVDHDAGARLYRSFGVELEYEGAQDFLRQAIMGEHAANLVNVIKCARENAIICRAHIETEAFGEMMELHQLFTGMEKSPIAVDYRFIDRVHSLIREIWGSLSKREHRKSSDYFFRLGKLVEEADFHLRFCIDDDITMMIMSDIDAIVHVLAPDEKCYICAIIEEKKQNHMEIMDMINDMVGSIIIE